MARSLVRYRTRDVQLTLHLNASRSWFTSLKGEDLISKVPVPEVPRNTSVTKPGPPGPLRPHWHTREDRKASHLLHSSQEEVIKGDRPEGRTWACVPTTASVPSPCQTTLPGLMSSSQQGISKPSRAGNVFLLLRDIGLIVPAESQGQGRRAVASEAARSGSCMATLTSVTLESLPSPQLLVNTWGVTCFSEQA